MARANRNFIGGPLNGRTINVEDTVGVYPHNSPEGKHYYTLQELNSGLHSGEKVLSFMYQGYEEPHHDPATRLCKPPLPKRRRIQLRKPRYKATPTTLNGKEVAKRYMRVIKWMRGRMNQYANRYHIAKKENVRLREALKSKSEDIDELIHTHEKQVQKARMAVVDLEYLMEESLPGHHAFLPSAEQFEEFLDESCTKDYEQWRFLHMVPTDKTLVSLRQRRKAQAQREADYMEYVKSEGGAVTADYDNVDDDDMEDIWDD